MIQKCTQIFTGRARLFLILTILVLLHAAFLIAEQYQLSNPVAHFLTTTATTASRGTTDADLTKIRSFLSEWLGNAASQQEIAAVSTLKQWLERSQNTAEVSYILEQQSSPSNWSLCATEHRDCDCPSGTVRYGLQDTYWVEKTNHKNVMCNSLIFGQDPAPGKEKQCQCFKDVFKCPGDRDMDMSRCPTNTPCRAGCAGVPGTGTDTLNATAERTQICADRKAYELLWSCKRQLARLPAEDHPHAIVQKVFDAAVAPLCADPTIATQLDVYLDCEFKENYLFWTSQRSEWLEEAYVTYVAGAKNSKYEWQAMNLVRSVNLFSTRPIVAVVFDTDFVPPRSWYKLPKIIVYKMRPGVPGVSFNFNKIRAMIAARTVVGIELDTDQIIYVGMDRVFDSTRREVNEHYPWPMMPVHWMSRDETPGNPYVVFAFRHYSGKRTMRWGHAHPSWSFWALPWLCDLLNERLLSTLSPGTKIQVWNLARAPKSGLADLIKTSEASKKTRTAKYRPWMDEDEDMMNVGLWRDGVSKEWCKFDIEPDLFTSSLESNLYWDPDYFPNGIPVIFISAHNTKNFEETNWLLLILERCSRDQHSLKCQPRGQTTLEICKPGSAAAHRALRTPKEFASKVCCCLHPRAETPIFWAGSWYTQSRDVPDACPRGRKKRRLCVMP